VATALHAQLGTGALKHNQHFTRSASVTDFPVFVPPCVLPLLLRRLDWRQVWSCLERAQTGPWQLDARRLTPEGFPHGVLLTFELLLQQPAPPAEPGAREQHTGGWRDCVTVLSFTLDGKTVEITVDASGK
jgi:hypothetical protein